MDEMASKLADSFFYSSVIAGEVLSALVLAIIMFAMLLYREPRKSSHYLFLSIAMAFLFLLGDAASYYNLAISALPIGLMYVTYFVSYTFGLLVVIPFSLYVGAFIREKTPVKKWVFQVPVAAILVSVIIAAAAILTGSVYGVVDGKMAEINGLPAIVGLIQIAVALYLPIAAFTKRKQIGLKAVLLLGLFGIVPVVLFFVCYTYTGIGTALALIFVYVLLQCDISVEKESHRKELEALNGELEERQAQLEELTAEQEAQIEEISALNGELEEHQAQLEETSNELSDALRKSHDISDTMNGIHEAMGSAHWSVLFDENGKEQETTFSDEMRRLLGYDDNDELPNGMLSLTSLVHPDDLSKTVEATKVFFSDQAKASRMNLLYRLQTKSNGYRWFRANSVMARREDGSPESVHGVIMDVNELEQTRQDLTDAIDATNAIHDSLGSGDWQVFFAPDGSLASVVWSDRFRTLIGYSDESDFPNRLESWTDLLHPEDKERVILAYRSAMADRTGNTIYDVTYRMLCKDGQYRYFRSLGMPTRADDGSLKVFYGMFIDVTDRETHRIELEALNTELEERQAQLEGLTAEQEAQIEETTALNGELEERQAQLEELTAEQEAHIEEVTALNDELTESRDRISRSYSVISSLSQFFSALYYVDLVTYEYKNALILEIDSVERIAGTVGDARDTFRAIAEGTVEEESRRDFAKFTDVTTLADRLQDTNSISQQFLGSTIGWFEGAFIAAERDDDGRCTHVIWTVRSVNEQKQQELLAQRELEAAKTQAEAANTAKSSFLFSMSHDIRTPMNAIIGFRDLLEKHQDDPVRRADYLRKIESSSDVLLSIINNVLEMARIEKGAVEIDETAWSAEQFNDTLYSVFADMMRQKGIEFTRDVEVSDHYVYCDPIKLREVFINILSNAYKYTNPGGTVHMDLRQVEGPLEGFAYYRTTVTDTGIGMSEEFLPHLFEEFSRESTTTESQVEGTGLGMPIVKRLVELMGGTIEVESQLGAGTTFTVTIPHRIAERSALVEHAGVEVDPRLFEGRRILLAEDNDLNAEIAVEILGEAGFAVERAEDGAAAMEMLMRSPVGHFDVILMDIQMPNMNGYEATRAIRKLGDSAKASIPILAMTANAFEEDKREAIRSGMNGHLAKPINVTELMKALASVLG